ncbi:epsin-3 isoform X1 [Melanerpes formicivorus]|uniref:epsin-3 isoform X1 n=1 Tax=Melanerpes formicivorus TaxID=211600 RepID=UPI00358F8030
MTTSALRRQVKNIVHNYSEAEIKVREATSNDPWGPPSSLMSEIADLTFNTVAFAEVMGMIWRRLNDSGKNWRHVYKALTLLDYLIKTGSEKVTHQCRENLYTIQTLKDFQYVDRDGKDQGINVREKVKQVMALLKDEERLKQERAHALQTKERMALEGMGSGSHQPYGRRASPYADDYGRARGSPSSFNSSSSSPRFTSDLEQARPQTTGEEELQLQLALAMSREEAEKKPLPPLSSTDEERQLQLALALSKEEHEKEVRAWQGENSVMQKPTEETSQGREEEEDKMKKSQSSILELADIFGPAAAPSSHTSSDPWDMSDMKAKAEPAASAWAGAADPWVPVPAASGESLSQASASSQQPSTGPWDFPPGNTAASDPWGKVPLSSGFPPADPWVAASPPAQVSGSTPAVDPWAAVAEQPPNPAPGADTFDPFAKPPELLEQEPSQLPSSAKSNSPVELDPFSDLFPGTRQDETKSFDLTNLADSLPESGKERKDCKTPEAFLGPAASSLVNLDSLVAPTPASKTRNPFLSGLSTPSPTNPFGLTEQPKPTLNQMRTSSPVPSLPAGHPANSMTYSTSLPLPLSSVPAAATALPVSASAFPQAGTFPELPSSLPQPLLPLSGSPAPPSAPGGLNPFL